MDEYDFDDDEEDEDETRMTFGVGTTLMEDDEFRRSSIGYGDRPGGRNSTLSDVGIVKNTFSPGEKNNDEEDDDEDDA